MSDNCTSKFAMVGMMESLDHELTLAGYDGVNSTIVFPASINTAVNKKNVCIPKELYLIACLKSILPTKAFMLLANFVLQPSRPNFEISESN